MSEELEKAYASNTATPLNTIRIKHSGIAGGSIDLVQGYYNITATLEDSTVVTFLASGFGIKLPNRSTDGRQDLQITLDNVSKEAWTQISAAKVASRSAQEKIVCEYRPFLEADLSAPAGATYKLTVRETSINRNRVSMTASYAPIPDISYPRKRYYSTDYPGVKYV